MIPTSAHAGITATRPRHRLLAALLALLVILGMAIPTASPARAETTPTPSPTLSGETLLSVAVLGNGLLTPGETLTAFLSLQNGTGSRFPGGEATLYLGDAPLADRDGLSSWLDGSRADPAGQPVGTAVVEAAASGETTGGGVQVPPTDPALQDRAPGVYPLWLTIGELTARTVVTVTGSVSGSVGVVVPVTAGPLVRGLLTREQIETLTAEDGALTAVLDAVEGTPAILAVDPAVPAAIRVLGTSAPAQALEWLSRLMALPNSRFALQFGDADVATQIDAGLPEPLQPTSLLAYVDQDALSSPATPTATPSPSVTAPADPEEGVPVVPDLTALLDIGAPDAPVVYWPAGGVAGPQVVSTLAGTAEGALTLLSTTTLTEDAGPVAARGTAGDGGVLLSDAAVSASLYAASLDTDTAERAADLAAVSAGLTLAAGATGGAPLLVTVEREAQRTRQGLRAAITAATTVPGISAVGLDALVAAPAAEVEVAETATDPARTEVVPVLGSEADSIARFATILDDPALLTGPQRAGILQVLGAAWLDPDADWPDAVARHRAATENTLSSVGILPSSALNLLTAGTNLRFWIHNELPYPVNVVFYAVPDDLRLDIERETVVTAAAASSNTPVEVPVRARLGNGEVQIDLSLRSPTLEPIGTDQTVDVNVRADWEGIGLIAMVVLVAGFLIIGVIRTIRRRRRRATAAEESHE
ncbi:hypothetical protein F6J84_15300 [Microbacterium caowuchunii]|uniref:DUF6049 family protein n=1 Tax=Microbacterium caowuchunii TaxID=2614638 RepID=UPI00124871A4|nr:DUF6049 family protein [Microbacterium caowuchunii]QEW01329.1 hypothetical protein F6J84_15300 [Microbacterium caowuchunii]